MAEQPPPPQWAPPPQQPQWGAPPPGAWGQPGYSAPPPRPTGVTIGSIWLIVLGILWTLAGAACAIGGAAFTTGDSQLPGLGAVGGAVAVFGVILLVIGVLQILAGAGALGGKGWGRWLGIVLSILFVIFGAFGLLGSLGSLNQSGGLTALGFTAIYVLGYAFTAWALISAGAFFSYRR